MPILGWLRPTLCMSQARLLPTARRYPRDTRKTAKVSPPLTIEAVPAGTASIVLIVEDADSPTPAPLVHALAWDILPDRLRFAEADLDVSAMPTARREATFGNNSFFGAGWLPPDPPPGHGPHPYAFQVFALDKTLGLAEGTGRHALIAAVEGHVIAKGLLIGLYER